MIVDEKMAGAAILCGEPLIGYSPTDIRQWLQENGHTDAAIAEAMAAVGQKVGWLHHELNDPDNDDAQISKYDKEFDAWWDMEKELVAEIIHRLEEQNRIADTNHTTEGKEWQSSVTEKGCQNSSRDGRWHAGK